MTKSMCRIQSIPWRQFDQVLFNSYKIHIMCKAEVYINIIFFAFWLEILLEEWTNYVPLLFI